MTMMLRRRPITMICLIELKWTGQERASGPACPAHRPRMRRNSISRGHTVKKTADPPVKTDAGRKIVSVYLENRECSVVRKQREKVLS